MTTNEHTHAKTPWKFDRHGVLISLGDRGRTIGKLFGTDPVRQVAEANAALIVRAVNRDAIFDSLFALLKRLEFSIPSGRGFHCPECDRVQLVGHAEHCEIGNILSRAKAME